MEQYNTDKYEHGFIDVYEPYFNSMSDSKNILEIGVYYGGSVKYLSDKFKDGIIYGIDIEDKTQYDEDRIKTYYCDQQNPDIIKEMWSNPELEEKFDIIIEDGLHEYNANVCFFENSIHKLKSGGYYIIEDIKITEVHLFINKINNEWKNKYNNYSFTLLNIPSTRNTFDNCLLVITKQN